MLPSTFWAMELQRPFYLAADPYFPAASKSTIISELFNEPQINQQVWGNSSGSGYLSLGAGGLVMNGGNGIDGETLLTWLDPVEMGGTLLLEAVGVTLSPGSTGILAGFFMRTGDAGRAAWRAFRRRRSAGHRGSYLAAHDSGTAGGNSVSQSIRPTNIRCA